MEKYCNQSLIGLRKSITNPITPFCHLTYIVEFYPCISVEFFDRVICGQKNFVDIFDANITMIKHARKSVLFNREQPWVKRNNDSMFDVTMGSFDGAEICELVGLFILNVLSQKFGKEYI